MKLDKIWSCVGQKYRYDLCEMNEYFPVTNMEQLERLENAVQSSAGFDKKLVSLMSVSPSVGLFPIYLPYFNLLVFKFRISWISDPLLRNSGNDNRVFSLYFIHSIS
jgi:hypothetical protein